MWTSLADCDASDAVGLVPAEHDAVLQVTTTSVQQRCMRTPCKPSVTWYWAFACRWRCTMSRALWPQARYPLAACGRCGCMWWAAPHLAGCSDWMQISPAASRPSGCGRAVRTWLLMLGCRRQSSATPRQLPRESRGFGALSPRRLWQAEPFLLSKCWTKMAGSEELCSASCSKVASDELATRT